MRPLRFDFVAAAAAAARSSGRCADFASELDVPGVLIDIRNLARSVAQAYHASREVLGFPMADIEDAKLVALLGEEAIAKIAAIRAERAGR